MLSSNFALPPEANPIGMAVVGRHAPKIFVEAVKQRGYLPLALPENTWTYTPVNDHPDLFFCTLPKNKICFMTSNILPYVESVFQTHLSHWQMRFSETEVGGPYPTNVGLNALTIGQFVVANMKFIDHHLLQQLKTFAYEPIHVNQGYVRCTTLKIDESSCLTSDLGIASQLKSHGIAVLYVDPRTISLKGFDYGFIGGAAVKIDKSILFNGNIKKHPQYESIEAFIQMRGLSCTAVGEGPIEDIGGIELFEF